MFKPRAVFFDLDGTLVDSVADMAFAVGKMLSHFDLPAPGIEKVSTWVGNGAQALINRALTNDMHGTADKALFDQAMPLFNRYYHENLALHSALYEHVEQTLQTLKNAGLALACITNKPEQFTEVLLENINIAQYFSLVVSGDTLPTKKPHPGPLLHAAQEFGVHIDECLMVGDSKSDIEAAKKAGCPVVALSYGYNHGENIRLHTPDITIDSLKDLPPLLSI
ncbi:Phosphoglycolate phosphatase [gamma proteobacterium IMCC2047]|nr:Phosphoglycolate phosphatase [gamma proteobacterium IMCC2047]